MKYRVEIDVKTQSTIGNAKSDSGMGLDFIYLDVCFNQHRFIDADSPTGTRVHTCFGYMNVLKSAAARRIESGKTLYDLTAGSRFEFLFQPYKTGAECGEGFAVDTGSIREPELSDVYIIDSIDTIEKTASKTDLQEAIALFMGAFCSADSYLLIAPVPHRTDADLIRDIELEALGFKEIRNGVMLCDNNARPDYQYKEIHND